MNLLIVEDDFDTASHIGEMLSGWGHRVETSATGGEALKKAANNRFDLVLLDIFLPDLKGYELIPRLKGLCPDTKIVTMTGYNSRELEWKVRKQGILYYMIKPFEGKSLKSILDHLTRTEAGRS